ncbi:MAG: glycosyltransferase family 4 protein [Rhodobacteraceae bacterium]|nr:glycosyltransferase family 4 protein [Paracoccaceae bacterium]
MIKITFIIKQVPETDISPLVGGSAKAPYRMIKYLSNFVDVQKVIYFEGSKRKDANNIRVSVRFAKLYLKTILQNLLSARMVLKAFRESDVVQCHHPHYGFVAAFLKATFFKDTIFIVKAHGTALPELSANRYVGLKKLLLSASAWFHLHHDRYVLNKCDICLCSSDFQKNEMIEQYKMPPARILTIRNGYDPEFFSTNEGARNDDVIVCARCVPKKGVEYAIELFNNFCKNNTTSSLNLVLGAKTHIEDPRTYKKILKGVENNPRIRIYHDLNEDALGSLMRNSKVGLIPSKHYESIPSVVYEMAASGLRILATYKWGIPEILNSNTQLTGNIQQDTVSLDALIRSDDSNVGDLNRKISENSYAVLAHKYLDLYKELNEKKGSP